MAWHFGRAMQILNYTVAKSIIGKKSCKDRLTFVYNIDLKIDNLDRVCIPTKIVATFDVEHPILGTTCDPK